MQTTPQPQQHSPLVLTSVMLFVFRLFLRLSVHTVCRAAFPPAEFSRRARGPRPR